MSSDLGVRECGITVARVGVARLHRHLRHPPPSGLVAFELVRDGWPIGWAMVGRPVGTTSWAPDPDLHAGGRARHVATRRWVGRDRAYGDTAQWPAVVTARPCAVSSASRTGRQGALVAAVVYAMTTLVELCAGTASVSRSPAWLLPLKPFPELQGSNVGSMWEPRPVTGVTLYRDPVSTPLWSWQAMNESVIQPQNSHVTAAVCAECGGEFDPTRATRITCSNRCRQRRHRKRHTYVLTDEDRAAIRKVMAEPIPGLPREPYTSEQVRAHILATAERTDDGEEDG